MFVAGLAIILLNMNTLLLKNQNQTSDIKSFFVNPKFLDIAEQILGPDIILHHTKLFQKPQGKGAPFPMHQDWQYFPTVKDTMIAGIIHVSEARWY